MSFNILTYNNGCDGSQKRVAWKILWALRWDDCIKPTFQACIWLSLDIDQAKTKALKCKVLGSFPIQFLWRYSEHSSNS